MKLRYLIRFCIILLLTGCNTLKSSDSTTDSTGYSTNPSLEATSIKESEAKNILSSPGVFASSTAIFTPPYETPSSIKDRDQLILDYLKNGKKCKLPCFLGITPGNTGEGDVIKLLNSLALDVDKFPDRSAEVYSFSWKEKSGEAFLSMQIYVDNGIVTVMEMNTTELDEDTYTNYSFDHFLSVLGTPDEVLVAITPYDQTTEPPPPQLTLTPTSSDCCKTFHDAGYYIRFVYKNVWLLFGVDGYADQENDQYRFCPKRDMDQQMTSNRGINMILQSAEHQVSVSKLGEKYQIMTDGLPVEKVTGMTLNAFMKEYRDGNCFTSPENLWKP